MDAVRDEFVTVEGLRLHYRCWNADASAGDLVLVHGLASDGRIWDLVAPELPRDLRVLALDQRGHGESEQPETGYDFASVVGDLAAFLDAVGASTRPVLVGHSWGASVVLAYAAAHPGAAAGIVLVDGGLSSPGERWSWEQTVERLTPPSIDGVAWRDLWARMQSRAIPGDDPRVELVMRSLFHVDADGRVRRRFRIPNHMQVVRALWEHRPLDDLRRVTCPVLALPARRDGDDATWRDAKAAATERALQAHPDLRVRWFEDTIHDVPLQRPSDLAAEIGTFTLRLLESGRASAPAT